MDWFFNNPGLVKPAFVGLFSLAVALGSQWWNAERALKEAEEEADKLGKYQRRKIQEQQAEVNRLRTQLAEANASTAPCHGCPFK